MGVPGLSDQATDGDDGRASVEDRIAAAARRGCAALPQRDDAPEELRTERDQARAVGRRAEAGLVTLRRIVQRPMAEYVRLLAGLSGAPGSCAGQTRGEASAVWVTDATRSLIFSGGPSRVSGCWGTRRHPRERGARWGAAGTPAGDLS